MVPSTFRIRDSGLTLLGCHPTPSSVLVPIISDGFSALKAGSRRPSQCAGCLRQQGFENGEGRSVRKVFRTER